MPIPGNRTEIPDISRYPAPGFQGRILPQVGPDPAEESRMHAPMKYVEKGLSIAANGVWQVFSTANKISQNPSFIPRWSDKPLLKS